MISSWKIEMTIFEDLLCQIVAPQLQPLGYEYAAGLRAADELYSFRKPLGDDVQAIVQFQVRHSTPESFTVNVLRMNVTGYECGARLSYVLWYVEGVREYPASDYWWTTSEANLQDAAAKVTQYGARWIEDLHAPRPWEMPAHDGREFVAAVEQIFTPVMGQHGYRLAWQRLNGEVPYLYFIKDWPDGTHSFIELQTV
jgi:hypothetical protein